MLNIETIFLFLFVFTIISCLRLVFKFIVSLLQTPPERLDLSIKSLIFYGISLSYIITYLIRS